jgi:hypothetical protein
VDTETGGLVGLEGIGSELRGLTETGALETGLLEPGSAGEPDVLLVHPASSTADSAVATIAKGMNAAPVRMPHSVGRINPAPEGRQDGLWTTSPQRKCKGPDRLSSTTASGPTSIFS